MYLLTGFSHSIFVSVKKKRHPVKFPKTHIKTVLGIACSLLAFLPVQGQQLYPGDVSGNGFVDHQDVLFWAYARGTEGAPRPNATTTFEAQDIDLTGWSGTYPGTERSFAYADCNGDGKVDDSDLLVIESNYYSAVDGPYQPDPFQTGASSIGSQLVLGDSASIDVTPGELAVIPFNLATQETQDIELGYMGFQLNYGLSLVAETPAGDPAIELNFDVDGNEWLMEAEQGVEVFVYHHENLGYSDIALYMGSPGDYVVGTGAIAEFSIVVEEVIFGLQSVNIDIPVILNGGFKRSGFVSSQGITLNLVGKPVSTDEQMLPLDAVMVFPNPVNTGVLHAQLRSDQPGMIKQMELFDQAGRLVDSYAPNARSGQLNASALPAGLYLLKVKTDKGLQVMKIQATR
jgi:hypothetical protein